MGLKEDLEAKEQECQTTEDFVNLAKEVMQGVSDKEWADRLFEDGAYWAAAADDFAALAKGALEIFEDKEKAIEYMNQGKDYCTNVLELVNMAKAASELGEADAAKEMIVAAQAKCVKIKDFIDLSKTVQDVLADADLAKETADKALSKCSKFLTSRIGRNRFMKRRFQAVKPQMILAVSQKEWSRCFRIEKWPGLFLKRPRHLLKRALNW